MGSTARPTPLADPVARATSPGSGGLPDGGLASLIPELSVTDLANSLRFWCGAGGFDVVYDRPAAGFAFIARGSSQVMLCQRNDRWDVADTVRPFGRGMNFQIAVDDLDSVLAGLQGQGWPLFEAAAEAWYRAGNVEIGQREFLVQDPDGYLLRFAERLGVRPVVG